MRTWWRYNWLTVVIAASAIGSLTYQLIAERRAHYQPPVPLSCWPAPQHDSAWKRT